MPRRRPQPNPAEHVRQQAEENELSNAQSQAQSTAQAHQDGPLVDLGDGEAGELLDRLTQADIESAEFEEIEDLLKPYLSQTQMLAAHGEDYYDDLSHELLNENLVERVTANRRRGRYLTGPFLEVAQAVEGDYGPLRRPLSEVQREALRTILVQVRTDRQSLGDETFFAGLTEMHVSSEVRRDGAETGGETGGLLSTINPFS